MAMSSDGNIIALRSPFHYSSNDDVSGRVQVLFYNDNEWLQRGLDLKGFGTR